MDFRKIFLPLVIVFVATALRAVDGPSETQPKGDAMGPKLALIADAAKQTELVIPKRDLKFDVSDAEESLPLENVQEGMLDQRYVATFRLKLVTKEVPPTNLSGFPVNSQRTIVVGIADQHLNTLGNILNYSPIGITDNQNQSGSFIGTFSLFIQLQAGVMGAPVPFHRFDKGMTRGAMFGGMPAGMRAGMRGPGLGIGMRRGGIANLPQEFVKKHQQAKEIDAKFLQSNPFFEVQYIPNDENSNFLKIGLLAPTVEEAKQWTKGWLAYYDWALCHPAQLECLKVKKIAARSLERAKESLEKATSELTNLEKDKDKFNEFEDLKPESIAALITQRRMLSIDLVGIKARIQACNNMLEDLKRNPERNTIANRQQPENAKVAAEIELLGLEAKRTEIDRIIQGAQDRQKYFANINGLNLQKRQSQSQVSTIEDAIQEIAIYQLGYQALPVEDGTVTIRRIKWTSPPKADEPKK